MNPTDIDRDSVLIKVVTIVLLAHTTNLNLTANICESMNPGKNAKGRRYAVTSARIKIIVTHITQGSSPVSLPLKCVIKSEIHHQFNAKDQISLHSIKPRNETPMSLLRE
jgi:hypothetical protein